MFKTTLLVASQSFITLEMEGQNKCISLCDTASHKIIELHGKQINFKEYHIIINISHGLYINIPPPPSLSTKRNTKNNILIITTFYFIKYTSNQSWLDIAL